MLAESMSNGNISRHDGEALWLATTSQLGYAAR